MKMGPKQHIFFSCCVLLIIPYSTFRERDPVTLGRRGPQSHPHSDHGNFGAPQKSLSSTIHLKDLELIAMLTFTVKGHRWQSVTGNRTWALFRKVPSRIPSGIKNSIAFPSNDVWQYTQSIANWGRSARPQYTELYQSCVTRDGRLSMWLIESPAPLDVKLRYHGTQSPLLKSHC